MTASFPGGLRAQLLVGLSAMLLATLALGGIIVENMLTRRLLQERHAQAVLLAEALAASESVAVDEIAAAPRVAGVVDDAGTRHSAAGDEVLVERLRELARSEQKNRLTLALDGRRYAAVWRTDGERLTAVAVEVGSVREDVAQTRGFLVLFLGVVSIFVLALGTAFFTHLVLRPIRAIGVATERAAHGDLASPIGHVPRNEYGRVARSFNLMLERLERGRTELQTKVRELERSHAALQNTRDSLVRSEKLASVGQLAAGIAHEIGNPLAALSGFNEIMLDADLSDEERRDLLERSGVQLDRIREVIRNLLDFSREDRVEEPQPVDLARTVDEAVALVSALPGARRIEVVVTDLSGSAVKGIASQVVQVLVNLTMNALDAMLSSEVGTKIVVTRRDLEDGRVELQVADDGPGVPPELRARIFDPFFTTKEPGAGTGLGLSICARIMESFGGELQLRESEGGACFVLLFPEWEDGA